MSEQTDEVTKTETASEDLVEVEIGKSEGTQEVEVKPSDANAQNGNTQKDVSEQTDAKDEAKAEVKPTQRNLEAEAGKMSKLEKERNEYLKELESTRKEKDQLAKEADAFKRLEATFQRDPDAYEAFRKSWKRETGVDLGEHATRYSTSSKTEFAPQFDPETFKASVKQETISDFKQQLEAESAFEKFVTKYPEMNPKTLSDDQKAIAGKNFETMMALVGVFQKNEPSMSLETAFEEAYNSIPSRMKEQLQSAKETGELIGMAKAIGRGVGETPNLSGAAETPSSTRTVRMTRGQQERYQDLLANNPKIAQRYAEQIAKG